MKHGRASAFARGVRKLARRVDAATEQWLDAPTVRNTHWLRTSLRRMDACLELLPKRARTAARTRRFRKRCRRLFSTVGAIRDADVMREKLGDHLLRIGPHEARLPEDAPRKRRHGSTLELARPLARKLLEAKKPRLDDQQLDEVELDARFAKVVSRHGDRLREKLPAAVADATRIDDLHDARKAAKQLRYAYELGGEDVHGRRLAWITALQDLLGDLHDRDVLIATLAELPPSPELRRVIEGAREMRRAKHEELATWLRRTPTLVDVVAPPRLLLPSPG
jgi:CHAD domain-containing protein